MGPVIKTATGNGNKPSVATLNFAFVQRTCHRGHATVKIHLRSNQRWQTCSYWT